MGKKTIPGGVAVAEVEEVQERTPERETFISRDPGLVVWLESTPPEQVVVSGRVVTKKEKGSHVRFKDNFASCAPREAERLKQAKAYGRSFISVNEVTAKMKSADVGERRSMLPFIEELERKRNNQNMQPITEKVVRLPE
jgi:hypothetical protein